MNFWKLLSLLYDLDWIRKWLLLCYWLQVELAEHQTRLKVCNKTVNKTLICYWAVWILSALRHIISTSIQYIPPSNYFVFVSQLAIICPWGHLCLRTVSFFCSGLLAALFPSATSLRPVGFACSEVTSSCLEPAHIITLRRFCFYICSAVSSSLLCFPFSPLFLCPSSHPLTHFIWLSLGKWERPGEIGSGDENCPSPCARWHYSRFPNCQLERERAGERQPWS